MASDVALKVVNDNPIRQGRPVVSILRNGLTNNVLTTRYDQDEVTDTELETKWTNRFDDPTYYG